MKWRSMNTAPLNPYGKPWGPVILIWCRATRSPVSVTFDPWFGWEHRDCGPAWVVHDGEGSEAIAPEDAAAWMPFFEPQGEEANERAFVDAKD